MAAFVNAFFLDRYLSAHDGHEAVRPSRGGTIAAKRPQEGERPLRYCAHRHHWRDLRADLKVTAERVRCADQKLSLHRAELQPIGCQCNIAAVTTFAIN